MARERAVLYNVVAVLTLTLGVTTLYPALFAVVLLAGLFVIDGDLLRQSLRHSIAWTDYLVLAWFASSVATIAGVLGSSLEDDSVVREATYGFRQKRMEKQRWRSLATSAPISTATGPAERAGTRARRDGNEKDAEVTQRGWKAI
jgi:hypothetical protein